MSRAVVAPLVLLIGCTTSTEPSDSITPGELVIDESARLATSGDAEWDGRVLAITETDIYWASRFTCLNPVCLLTLGWELNTGSLAMLPLHGNLPQRAVTTSLPVWTGQGVLVQAGAELQLVTNVTKETVGTLETPMRAFAYDPNRQLLAWITDPAGENHVQWTLQGSDMGELSLPSHELRQVVIVPDGLLVSASTIESTIPEHSLWKVDILTGVATQLAIMPTPEHGLGSAALSRHATGALWTQIVVAGAERISTVIEYPDDGSPRALVETFPDLVGTVVTEDAVYLYEDSSVWRMSRDGTLPTFVGAAPDGTTMATVAGGFAYYYNGDAQLYRMSLDAL